MNPATKILLQVVIRALQMTLDALKEYVKQR